jgi:glucose/mannose-6-phosphate isomerase
MIADLGERRGEMDLDEVERFCEVDRSDMMRLVLDFPEEIIEAVDIGNRFSIPEEYNRFSKILVTGMGGSAVPGDFLRSLLWEELPVPLVVNRDYSFPRFADSDTLAFAISYSGATEETIAAFRAAKEAGVKIVGITSGAELLLLCRKFNIPYLLVPGGRQTRASFGYLLFSILKVLEKIGIIRDRTEEVQETVQVIKKMREEIGPGAPSSQNSAKSLAVKLFGKFPVIFGTRGYSDIVALRWKQQFNENSKILARCEAFPELNHNEIVAWGLPGIMHEQGQVIFLRDEQEPPRIRKRIEVTREFLNLHGIDIAEVWSCGRSPLARALSLSYFGDFVSLYLAILKEVDPTPTEAIAFIKQKMASWDS